MTHAPSYHVALEAASSLASRGRTSKSPRYLFFDVTISARRGRSLVLLGPNGCGKTSVVRALIGLASLSSGKRTGHPGLCFAYMPQDYRNAFFPWLSLQENVALRFHRSGQGRRRDADVGALATDEMASLCRRLDLEVDLKRYPDEVSGGQLQLVLFVATIVMPGDVRVLDEPFSALDFRRRVAACEMMSERVAAKPDEAWVAITHDIGEAVQLADEVAVFSTGRSILAQITVDLPWPRGLGVLEDVAGLSAIRAVREAVGIA